MRFKNIILSLAGALSITLFSLPASAVSPDGNWTLTRNNTAGSFYAAMRPHATRFCFLTKVEIEDTDTSNEHARCHVRRIGSYWYLQANLGKSSDADVSCSASCYRN